MTTTNKTFSAFTLLALIVIIIFLLLKTCSGTDLSTSNDYHGLEGGKVYTEERNPLEEENTNTSEVIADNTTKNSNVKTDRYEVNQPSEMEKDENKKVATNVGNSQNLPPISTDIITEKPEEKQKQGTNSIVGTSTGNTNSTMITTNPELESRGGSSNPPNPIRKKLPPPYDYNKKSLEKDFMNCTPSMANNPLPKFIKRLERSSAPNLIIRGKFSDGTDEYKLKDYIIHLRNTGPYTIEVSDIQKDREGRMMEIKLKETQTLSKLPPTPYDYNKKSLAEDLKMCTPSVVSNPLPKFIERLQHSSAPNLIIRGEFSDGMDEYKLKDYISHLRSTGPYVIEVFDIQKDREGRMTEIKLKEAQINSERFKYNNPKRKSLNQPKQPMPYNYSEKSLAADFMKLDPNLTSNQIVKLKERIHGAFAPNAVLQGEFSDGMTQYKLKNYIAHLRTTGPYIVKISDMIKDNDGRVVSIQLKETQTE